MQIEMTEDEYQEHCNNYDGVCLECGEIADGGTEPDAEGYPCEACEAPRVMGIEQAMMTGHIVFND